MGSKVQVRFDGAEPCSGSARSRVAPACKGLLQGGVALGARDAGVVSILHPAGARTRTLHELENLDRSQATYIGGRRT